MSLPAGRYSEPFEGDDGQWYFHLQDRNGRILTRSSEGYETKQGAENGIDAAIKASQEAYEPPEEV